MSTRKVLHLIMFSKIYLWKWMLLMRSNIWYQHSNFPVEFYIFHRRAISVHFFFESRQHFFSISDSIFCQLLKRIIIHEYILKYIANIASTKINRLKLINKFWSIISISFDIFVWLSYNHIARYYQHLFMKYMMLKIVEIGLASGKYFENLRNNVKY